MPPEGLQILPSPGRGAPPGSPTDLVPGVPIAFLVDGDNATASLIKPLLDEASKYGTLVIRRVYGDWTSPTLGHWKKVLQSHALSPIQQFTNVSGKNATDSALIIDAMDILHSGKVQGFCIVSSDSDYTRLAIRIRDGGLFVLGMGRATTPLAFVNACNVFTAIENLVVADHTTESDANVASRAAPAPSSGPGSAGETGPAARSSLVRRDPKEALPIIQQAYRTTAGEAGRAHLAALGNTLLRLDPAFDARTYGRTKLVELLESFGGVFVIERHPERGPGSVYVKMRDSSVPNPRGA